MTKGGTIHIDEDNNLLTPVVHRYRNQYNPLVEVIVSSPYIGKRNLLHLGKLERPYQLVAYALLSFSLRLDKNYAFDEYEDIFNLEEIRALVEQYSLQINYRFPGITAYVIAFCSSLKDEVRKSATCRKELADIDTHAHAEANESGGLLKYWFGVPEDLHGRNLATCYWRNKRDARKGGEGRAHREGVQKVKGWYSYWEILEFHLEIAPEAKSISLKRL